MAGLQSTQGASPFLGRWRHPGWSAALPVDPIVRRVGVAHVAALLATSLALLGSPSATVRLGAGLGLAICVGIGALRTANVRRPLALTTLVLDAAGTALLVGGTGTPASPYIFLALAGAWWAAHLRRRHSGATWAVVFAAAYAMLTLPGRIATGQTTGMLEDASIVLIVGVLADWFVRVDTRAIVLSEALASAPPGVEALAIRDGVTRAMGPMEVPLDVVLVASRAGLTVIQTELLAYLVLGLTNQEIADATNVSVPTVRYRLTRLYKTLGVRGRRAAAERASELGIAASAHRA